jgi:hypothetical protein
MLLFMNHTAVWRVLGWDEQGAQWEALFGGSGRRHHRNGQIENVRTRKAAICARVTEAEGQ